mmetsp:Transcript_1816/g.2637  ORF Transcript_1816/g.2637 Transcript_1816/m.2637 type:complete len:231 (-) Transcript_1816:248-940(-)
MNLAHALQVFLGEGDGGGGLVEEEGVVSVPCGMLLRLEESVEIPETGLDVVVCGHFLKAHLGEDLTELRTDLQEGMQMAAGNGTTHGIEVVSLELLALPGSLSHHVGKHISGGLLALSRKLGTFLHFIGLPLLELNHLATLSKSFQIGLGNIATLMHFFYKALDFVLNRVNLTDDERFRATLVHGQPLVLHGLAIADLANLTRSDSLEGSQWKTLSRYQAIHDSLGRAIS